MSEVDDEFEDAADTEQDHRASWRFATVGEWVEEWFAPVMAGPYVKAEEAGGRTWCAQWWRHRMVAERLDKLWRMWESCRLSDDESAMSGWWVYHADAHIRILCDGEYGPMYRCSPRQHHDDEPFPTIPAPDGWFQPVRATEDGS